MTLAVAVVVDVEAAVQPEARVEHERPDECARAVPRGLQGRRQRGRVWSEPEQAVRSKAMNGWLRCREDGCVGRQRQRCRRVRPREPESPGGKTIEIRRQPELAAERADAVCSQRVNRDQKHVAAAARAAVDPGGASQPAAPAGRERGKNDDDARHVSAERRQGRGRGRRAAARQSSRRSPLIPPARCTRSAARSSGVPRVCRSRAGTTPANKSR